MGAHEHILTAGQLLFTMAGYKTDRKHVPHSRGLKKADLMVKDFQLAGIRDLHIDVSLRHEFNGSCLNHMCNGEASHADANGAIDAAVDVDPEDQHRPTQKLTQKNPSPRPRPSPLPTLHTPSSTTSNIRLVDDRSYYRRGNSQRPLFILST
jgi:hypothetical protein